MNELLEVEPISGYQERSRIARRPGVYLYSELRSAGLVHLYVGQSGSPNGGIYGCYCQENNLCTPRREEGSRWRGGTSLPAAPAVTNAAMDELQRRGVRVPRDRTALFRNDPEAYEEWCRQASRFRAAEFFAGWRSSTTWSGRALKCMPFGNFVDRAMICTTGPCDQSARTVPHDSKGPLRLRRLIEEARQRRQVDTVAVFRPTRRFLCRCRPSRCGRRQPPRRRPLDIMD